ncbi:MAG: TldD/PmbA family protein [Sphingomonadaceae bacterium]
MLTTQEAASRAHDLVERARKAGADACDAAYIASSSQGVSVRLGELEDLERSESEHISLRVFVGKRAASIGSTDLSDAALAELADRAIAMARAAPEDPYAGLAPEEALAKGPAPDLDLIDKGEPEPAALRQQAEEAEDVARAVAGVTNSEGASASAGHNTFALATSNGFTAAYAGTSHGLSAMVLAGEGGNKQRDSAWRQARHGEDLLPPAEIGALAGERAVAKLNPGRVKSGPTPLVFSPRVAGSFIGHLTGAMSGAAIARGASFLLGKEDDELFAKGLRLVEEPHRPRGLRSRPFDGEGLPTKARDLVADGRLTGWLMNVAAAAKLGLPLTGHASRGASGAPGVSTSNLHVAAGSVSPDELMSDIADGIYITELIGQGVNGVTGDYSRGAVGFRIENGEVTKPVAGFTVAGNLLDMFAHMTPADDLEWFRAVNVPTLRIDGMTVAGD